MIYEEHVPYLTPAADISQRIAALQKKKKKENIETAWLDDPADILYFTGTVQSGVLLAAVDADPILYIKKSLRRAAEESRVTVAPYPGRKHLIRK